MASSTLIVLPWTPRILRNYFPLVPSRHQRCPEDLSLPQILSPRTPLEVPSSVSQCLETSPNISRKQYDAARGIDGSSLRDPCVPSRTSASLGVPPRPVAARLRDPSASFEGCSSRSRVVTCCRVARRRSKWAERDENRVGDPERPDSRGIPRVCAIQPPLASPSPLTAALKGRFRRSSDALRDPAHSQLVHPVGGVCIFVIVGRNFCFWWIEGTTSERGSWNWFRGGQCCGRILELLLRRLLRLPEGSTVGGSGNFWNFLAAGFGADGWRWFFEFRMFWNGNWYWDQIYLYVDD